jgi:hypothetical protein
VDDQFHARLTRGSVAKTDHLAKFPGRIDVEQRERWTRRIKSLARQMQHYSRILADRVKHHRITELSRNLAHDVDCLGLETAQMGEPPPMSIHRVQSDQRSLSRRVPS